MPSARDEGLAALRRRAEGILTGRDDGGRAWGHTERVYGLGRRLARQEEADRFIVGAAALLHEWAAGPGATEEEARRAWPTVPDGAVTAIREALGALDDRPEVAPALSLEARVLLDAHRLDELGAAGIAGLLLDGGARGATLYDRADPFAVLRELRPDEALVECLYARLATLPGRLHTPTARVIANRRVAIMLFYLEALRDELAEALADVLLPDEHWLIPEEGAPGT